MGSRLETRGFIKGVVLTLVLCIICMGMITYSFVLKPEPPPEPEIRYIEVPVEKIITEYVDIPVDMVREKVVYKNYTWRYFESHKDFKEWYHEQDFKVQPWLDCEDYALRIHREAHKQGYVGVCPHITEDKWHAFGILWTYPEKKIYQFDDSSGELKTRLLCRWD